MRDNVRRLLDDELGGGGEDGSSRGSGEGRRSIIEKNLFLFLNLFLKMTHDLFHLLISRAFFRFPWFLSLPLQEKAPLYTITVGQVIRKLF